MLRKFFEQYGFTVLIGVIMSAMLVMVGPLGMQFETGISDMANSMSGTIQFGNMIDMVVPDNKTYEMVDGPSFNAIINESVGSAMRIESVKFVDYKMPLDEVSEIHGIDKDGDNGVVAWYTINPVNNLINIFISTQKEGQDVIANEDCSQMFVGFTSVNLFDVGNFDVSNTINMERMFFQSMVGSQENKIFVKGIDKWDTSNVINMAYMFSYWGGSQDENRDIYIDLSNFNVAKVTNMSHMFFSMSYACGSNGNVYLGNLSNWDVGNVIDMSYMFYDPYSPNIVIGDIQQWNTENVTNMDYAFLGFRNSLNISNWNTLNVLSMNGCFMKFGNKNENINELDLSNWDLSECTNLNNSFLHIKTAMIKLPKNINSSASMTDVTSQTWCDATDNYKEYAAGTIPTGFAESHTLVSIRP